jgi:hypothetical protein
VTFIQSRSLVLSAIYQMGATCCAYSRGNVWAARCDCKYGLARAWPTAHEKGNGCPELRSIYGLVSEISDEEWGQLLVRTGGVPVGAFLEGASLDARLANARGAARQARVAVDRIEEALDG